ncbi:MAG: hypothetical protein ABEJ72_08205, partial [Candidatus Aenigmatarchaeota archaeon]
MLIEKLGKGSGLVRKRTPSLFEKCGNGVETRIFSHVTYAEREAESARKVARMVKKGKERMCWGSAGKLNWCCMLSSHLGHSQLT